MSQQPSDNSIAQKLADFTIKTLKPGGVAVGGLYGAWSLFVEDDVAKAIASTLIGFSLSYVGKLWEPIHQGNQQRFQSAGQRVEQAFQEGLDKAFATVTRADEAYLLCQALDCRDYKPEGMGARDRVFVPMLNDVFVPLELDASSIRPGMQRRKLRTSNFEEGQQIWDFLGDAQRVPAYRQLAIVAWGGYGKTTLLKYLAYVFGTRDHERFNVPFRVPILLPLRRYRQVLAADTPPDLPTLVMQHHVKALAELNPKVKNLPETWARNLLKQGEALVMFDGFDEIPESERPALSRWMANQMKRFDNATFILASRPRAYREHFWEPLRTQLWVRPLPPEKQADFVRQWYRAQEKLARGGRDTPEVRRDAHQNAENLIRQIQDSKRPELGDLAKIPLLLNLLATYHRSNPGVELPRQRAELYQDICTLQLRKRPDARDISLPLSPDERQRILQVVALYLMQQNLRLIPENRLVTLIEKILTTLKYPVKAQGFLQQIIDVSELVVRQGTEGCEFSHLSFQEFLAAKEIKDRNREDLLYPHLQDANREGDDQSWWRTTILLYAAQTNPTSLIREALRQKATDLAYACWQETYRTLDDPKIEAELEALKPTLQTSRYARLEELLQTGQWRAADQETYRLMITTVGKEEGQGFSRADLENFPCEDLKMLDQLWVKYSNGKWGFSVQKQIWKECGKPMSYGDDWEKFGDRVGWRKDGSWQDYDNLTFDLSISPRGEFPRRGVDGWGGFGISSLAQRLVNCSTGQS